MFHPMKSSNGAVAVNRLLMIAQQECPLGVVQQSRSLEEAVAWIWTGVLRQTRLGPISFVTA
jgi:hypothetical protein